MLIRSALLAVLMITPALADQTVHLSTVPQGAEEKVGGSFYSTLKLSEVRPASVTKLPADLSSHVLYGVLPMTGPAGTGIVVVLDSPDDKPARLFVDANRNGDLTDDAAVSWVAGPDSKQAVSGLKLESLAGVGSATLKLGTAEKPFDGCVGFWQYDGSKMKKATPAQVLSSKRELHYYRQYYAAGKLTIDGKPHDVLLLDDKNAGSYVSTADKPNVRMFVDLNDNGKLDTGEMFDVSKPMKIKGHVYEVKNVAADGTSFDFVNSTKVAYSPDDVEVGQIAPPFEAVRTDGKPVKFSTDYKGKIVLVDFWATWCVPCMAEVPNLEAALGKYHDKGFEILGVTLDQPSDGDKVQRVTEEKKITWPQLFGDAGNVKQVCDMYSVSLIPSAFLIDGDTGKILAAGSDLRGEGLEKALAKAMAARGTTK